MEGCTGNLNQTVLQAKSSAANSNSCKVGIRFWCCIPKNESLFMKAKEILETCLYADDLRAVEEFYRSILGLEVIARSAGRHVFFRCGNRVFLIFNPAKTLELGTDFPPHGTNGPGHAAFAVRMNELPAWRTFLEQNGVTIESEVTWPGGGRSLYFRDPAGNSLELATPKIWGIDENTLGLGLSGGSDGRCF